MSQEAGGVCGYNRGMSPGDEEPGVPVALALGSNLNDPFCQLGRAAHALTEALRDVRVSSAYRSAPMYRSDQPEFLNAVLVGRWRGGPVALLRRVKDLEVSLGRVPGPRNGPRALDVDVLQFGALWYRSLTHPCGPEPLEIPHPRLGDRRFVLEPWAEVDPEARVPGLGSVRTLLAQPVIQSQRVERLDEPILLPRS